MDLILKKKIHQFKKEVQKDEETGFKFFYSLKEIFEDVREKAKDWEEQLSPPIEDITNSNIASAFLESNIFQYDYFEPMPEHEDVYLYYCQKFYGVKNPNLAVQKCLLDIERSNNFPEAAYNLYAYEDILEACEESLADLYRYLEDKEGKNYQDYFCGGRELLPEEEPDQSEQIKNLTKENTALKKELKKLQNNKTSTRSENKKNSVIAALSLLQMRGNIDVKTADGFRAAAQVLIQDMDLKAEDFGINQSIVNEKTLAKYIREGLNNIHK